MAPSQHRSTLFPYTTLFRSWPSDQAPNQFPRLAAQSLSTELTSVMTSSTRCCAISHSRLSQVRGLELPGQPRSEEHTSELQSRPHLVCRLLLEKKKNLRFLK